MLRHAFTSLGSLGSLARSSTLPSTTLAQNPLFCRYAVAVHVKRNEKKIPVILTQSVIGLGVRGQTAMVKPGYARNYLFPHKKAILGSADLKDRFKPLLESVDYQLLEDEKNVRMNRRKLSKVVLNMKRHVNQVKGESILHAPVTKENISEKLLQHKRLVVNPENIVLDKPITKIGEFEIKIKISGTENVSIKLKLTER